MFVLEGGKLVLISVKKHSHVVWSKTHTSEISTPSQAYPVVTFVHRMLATCVPHSAEDMTSQQKQQYSIPISSLSDEMEWTEDGLTPLITKVKG